MSSHGPALFVHGNPETSAVWGPLLGELGRDDVVCLSPPGFGAPLPRGFEPTMTGYRDWLIARHWWMMQDPAEGARALTEFWSRLS
jgi:pimeloyl-ACP methyl ester carboxylesterase